MGEPVKIKALACKMVQLSGLNCEMKITLMEISKLHYRTQARGKAFEELLIDDNAQPTSHSRIMKSRRIPALVRAREGLAFTSICCE